MNTDFSTFCDKIYIDLCNKKKKKITHYATYLACKVRDNCNNTETV